MPASGDEFIDEAREAAFSFTETLPNYVVKQFTTRYAAQVGARRQDLLAGAGHMSPPT